MKKKRYSKKHHHPSGKRKSSFRSRPSTGKKDVKVPLNLLVHKPKKEVDNFTSSGRAFTSLSLDATLQGNIRKMGFTHMTPIQEDVWNPVLNERDVKGIAQTGTGKTIGYLLPLMYSNLSSDQVRKILILVPTRELALQVEQTCQRLLDGATIKVGSFIGGRSFKNDLINLKEAKDIVVGTTGRLKELIREGHLSINDFKVLILDEYDRMLDMGFHRDVKYIVRRMSSRSQTLLFSATMDSKVKKEAGALLWDPVTVKVSSGREPAEAIKQDIVRYSPNKKFDKLLDLLIDPSFSKVLIFCDTKEQVSNLYDHLDSYAVPVDQIHGDKTQAYRKRALEKFKKGEVRVLVATDVASRGLDIDEVSHVINYYHPPDYETYIHRIGRTGRAGKRGIALTFIANKK